MSLGNLIGKTALGVARSTANISPKLTTVAISSSCATFRPLITLSNKNVSEDTKKFTAKREFLTEIINCTLILSVVSAAEELIPRVLSKGKNFLGKPLTKEAFNKIKKSSYDVLTEGEKNLKAAHNLTSLFVTAVCVAIASPFVNNFILNNFLSGKKNKIAETQPKSNKSPMIEQQKNIFSQFYTKKL